MMRAAAAAEVSRYVMRLKLDAQTQMLTSRDVVDVQGGAVKNL